MAIKKGKNNGNKGNNGNDYDSMNPEAVNPNVKKAGKQLANFAKKIAKAIGKAIRKLIELLIKLGPVGIIILVILLIVVIIIAFFSMPGMMREKLLSLFKLDWLWLSGQTGAVSKLKDQKIVDVANYIEEMGYSLVGDGFVTPVIVGSNSTDYKSIEELREQYEYREDEKRFYDENGQVVSISYYDLTGKLIDNTTGEPVNGEVFTDKYGIERMITEDGKNKIILSYGDKNGDGEVSEDELKEFLESSSEEDKEKRIEYLKRFSLIRSYLLSNYRINTLKNNDETTLNTIYNSFQSLIGGNQDAWTKGLLKIYIAKGGVAYKRWSGEFNLFDNFELTDTTLSLKHGFGNYPMTFSIEGWSPRYGMNLDFLISLHLGTGAPDLTTAMLQNFDTEVQVYLDESGDASVKASFVDPYTYNKYGGIDPGTGKNFDPSYGTTFDEIKDKLENGGLGDADPKTVFGELWNSFWTTDIHNLDEFNKVVLTKKVCQAILRNDIDDEGNLLPGGLKIDSPDSCLKSGTTYSVEVGTDGSYRPWWLLWIGETSSNDLEENGINETVDPELYEEVSQHQQKDITFKNDEDDSKKFNMKNLTYKVDGNTEKINYANDNYAMIYNGYDPSTNQYDDSQSYVKEKGFDGNYEQPEESYFDLYYNSWSNKSNDNPMSFDDTDGDGKIGFTVEKKDVDEANGEVKLEVAHVKKVKNYNSWAGKVTLESGEVEEIEYRWISYKYIITNREEIKIKYEDWHLNQGGSSAAVYINSSIYQENLSKQIDTNNIKDVIFVEWVERDKNSDELAQFMEENSDGEIVLNFEKYKCSEDPTREECCVNCQKYVQAVVLALSSVSDPSYSLYTPYIARVVGSWFRDTYFVVPTEPDTAIKIYSGEIKEDVDGEISSSDHPEFDVKNTYTEDNGQSLQYVKVDKDYLADTGEYWTDYERKTNDDGTTGDYQLYLLLPDGTTSDIKMEDFLKDPKIDGVQAQIGGKDVSPYIDGGADINDEETIKLGKEKAEKDGWAFVKKAILIDTTSEFSSQNGGIINAQNAPKDKGSLFWSAYEFDSTGSAPTSWWRVDREDEYADDGTLIKEGNRFINNLYNMLYGERQNDNYPLNLRNVPNGTTGVFYLLEQTNTVTQTEDAYRGPTNPLVKYLFKYRKFYIYNGNEDRAVAIEHDKMRVLYGYDVYSNNIDTGDRKYYTDKVLADDDIFTKSEINSWENSGLIYNNNFYHFTGVLELLKKRYGENDWKDDVVALLSKFGRSAIRQSYSYGVITENISDEDLASQWLDWQLDMYYMDRYGVDLIEYYKIKPNQEISAILKKVGNDNEIHNVIHKITISSEKGANENCLLQLDFDPRDSDLINTVAITKSSLSAFTILENTNTIDADYAYRDFKELIVELDYFDKEELSEKIPQVFTWVFEGQDKVTWPVRPYDKADSDYGILIHSKDTYNDLKEYMKDQGIEINDDELIEESERETSPSGAEVSGVSDPPDFEGYNNDDMVLSPVTGKVLEIGRHDRLNIYTNQMENVGYIIIEVTEVPDSSAHGDDGLNLFYKEYTNVCEGYTIMIDGIDVDLSGGGFYEQNKVYGIVNTEELKERKEIEAKKEAAPFVLNLTGSSSVPTYGYTFEGNAYEGYFIKEGKYIGKAVAKGVNKTPVVTSSTIPDTEEKVTFNYDDYSGKTDYIRIIMKDTGYAIVDNVEDFFDPERDQKEDSETESTDSATVGAETHE